MVTKRKKRQKEQEKQLDFKMIHHNFTTNLESLEVFMGNVSPVVEKHDRALDKKVERFAKQVTKIVDVSKSKSDKSKQKKATEEITNEKVKQILKLAAGLPHLNTSQTELLRRSSFVMLASYFDFLIADLIHYFYRKYPDILSTKELPLTLRELTELGSMNDAIDSVINKEADKVLYDSLDKQKNYFKDTLKINTKDNIINWNRLEEAMERRNIIVHNNCKINRRYLANVDLSVIPEAKKDLKEDAEIHITEPYFKSVFKEICVSGFILIQLCWRKWEKDDISSADPQLIQDIYNELSKENWTCAERLGLFSKECKVEDQASNLILNVNYCQSLKWQGKKEELDEELKKFDISALSPKFVLAVYALRSDRNRFYDSVKNAVIVDKMSEESFTEWPLFRELRKDPDYEERIKIIFRSISEKEIKE